MPAELGPGTVPAPRRARYLIPKQFPRRGEIVAACVVLLLAAHLFFAQLTFLLAVVFAGTGKASRWRPSWLAVPAAAGAIWTLAIGPGATAAGFVAGPSRILGYLGTHGVLHIHGAFADAGGWLPPQFPLALIAAAAEAAIAAWLDWLHTDEWAVPPTRPGLAAAVRRTLTTRAIRGGAVVTRDGGTLGVAPATGARAALSWAEVARGVLFTGAAGRDITSTGFQLVHAALRLRKPVIVLDLTGDPAMGSALTVACSAAGTPLRTFGAKGGTYEPFRDADPARRTQLALSLLGLTGPGGRGSPGRPELCLRTAFELMTAVPAGTQTPVLEDVAHLLNPMAARARLRLAPADGPLAGELAERVRVAARLAQEEPETVAALARQLAEVRDSPAGGWLRSGDAGHPDIDLARVIRERSAALFQADSPGMARLVCADLLALGDDLRRLEVDGDAIVVLCGCEKLPGDTVTRLVDGGAAAGLPVLATTTSAAAAAGLAEVFGSLVIHRLTAADARGVDARVAADSQTASMAGPQTTSQAASPAAAVSAAESLAARTGMRLAPVATAPAAAFDIPGGTYRLAPRPVVPVATLLSLRTAQFAVAVQAPRRRLVALGQTVPARLPRPAVAVSPSTAGRSAVARLRASVIRPAARAARPATSAKAASPAAAARTASPAAAARRAPAGPEAASRAEEAL